MRKKKKARSAAAWLGAGTGETAAPSKLWPTVGVRIDPELMEDARDLARKLSRQQGSRVKLADVFTEALRDVVRKHKA